MKLSVRRLFFILLVMGLFLMTLRPVADPDFWWHLKAGQLIFQNHGIFYADPFSFTKAGQPWIMHEWLSELIIYGLFLLGNYWALILAFSIIITCAFLLAYYRTPTQSRPYISGFVMLLGAVATAPTWGVRPQIFSLLLLSLYIYLLDRYTKSRKIAFLFPMPLLMLVWVNLHAGYFLGLGVIAIFIVGSLGELSLPKFFMNDYRENQKPTPRRLISLLIVLGLSILATLANPNGINIVIYPFQTLTSPSMQQLIQEWMSPDFHQLMWLPLAGLFLGMISFGLLSKKRVAFTEILLTLIFGYGALVSMRNVPFFAIVSIPILSTLVAEVVPVPAEIPKYNRVFNITGFIILTFACFAIVFQYSRVVHSQNEIEAKDFPQAAVSWLLEHNPQGNIFNTYSWGGYIIWRAYPEYRVYIDGRADVYGDAFIFNYINLYHAEPGWDQDLIGQNIKIVLVELNSPLGNALRQSQDWKISYQDSLGTIFTR